MSDQHKEANRSNWNERARIHAASSFYDLDGFRSGTRNLWLHPCEAGEMGSVEGKRVCHLQCHLGVETLSWARLGAREVVGLDFSGEAIAVARQLARDCGLDARARFVEADFHDARSALEGMAPFDIVYVSVGAICWLPSIRVWAEVVRDLLHPGGTLYMREVHPVLNSVGTRDGLLVVDSPYFERAEPRRWDDGTTYTEGDHALSNRTCFEWAHGLGEIVQALLDVGMNLELLHEHRDAEFPAFPSMSRDEDGLYRLPAPERDHLPLTFTLRARASSAELRSHR